MKGDDKPIGPTTDNLMAQTIWDAIDIETKLNVILSGVKKNETDPDIFGRPFLTSYQRLIAFAERNL